MMGLGFDPWVPLWVIMLLLMAGVVLGVFSIWRGLPGGLWRMVTLILIAGALAGPVINQGTSQALSDIVILLDDRSASQDLGQRRDQTDRAVDHMTAEIGKINGTELRRVTVGDDPDGTLLGSALRGAMAAEPQARLAGIIAISDGLISDGLALPGDAPAPVHLLLTGDGDDWDRRLVIEDAPGFGLVDEEIMIRVRLAEEGQVPDDVAGRPAILRLQVDGQELQSLVITPGRVVDIPFTPKNVGANVILLTLDPVTTDGPPELSDANNAAAVTINGVRDRLRVLLISGEPTPSERTWRNLLKSDSAVDLIHFTILRPPGKSDGVPVSEMSLIAFPTQELFLERIADFDLIVFDRYRVRGILPPEYFDNIRQYVEQGGAILVAGGPELAGVESLHLSPLGQILPARPTGEVADGAFLPRLTQEGARHPVTADLPGAQGDVPDWGRWLRYVRMEPESDAEIVMQAENGDPLLVLARRGSGRVAMLGSDQVWLWGRGFEGGGPQLELLRRIAHWSMKEPELEEETLTVEPLAGQNMRLHRRTLRDQVGLLQITGPRGITDSLAMTQTAPGRFSVDWTPPVAGFYLLEQDGLRRNVALGLGMSRELDRVVADPTQMTPLVTASGGAVSPLRDGMPDLRVMRPGRAHAGQGIAAPWVAITPREAANVTGLTRHPLVPDWVMVVMIAMAALVAWLIEGRIWPRRRNRI